MTRMCSVAGLWQECAFHVKQCGRMKVTECGGSVAKVRFWEGQVVRRCSMARVCSEKGETEESKILTFPPHFVSFLPLTFSPLSVLVSPHSFSSFPPHFVSFLPHCISLLSPCFALFLPSCFAFPAYRLCHNHTTLRSY